MGSNKGSPLLPFCLCCRQPGKAKTPTNKARLLHRMPTTFRKKLVKSGSKQFCSVCNESDLEDSESFLPSFFAMAKLTRQDPYTLAAWFIYSACVGVSAQGFGKGGGRGKSPNKTFKCNSFDGAAVRGQLSEAVLL